MNVDIKKTGAVFATIGDVHDRFFKMEAALSGSERKYGRKLDFVLQVGGLQPCRDEADLETVAMPQKYRVLHDFQHIWRSGTGLPRPTYFIGGITSRMDGWTSFQRGRDRAKPALLP